MSDYNGSTELISGLIQANNGTYPLIDSPDVQTEVSKPRLNETLDDFDERLHKLGANLSYFTDYKNEEPITISNETKTLLTVTIESERYSNMEANFECNCEITVDGYTGIFIYGGYLGEEPKLLRMSSISSNRTQRLWAMYPQPAFEKGSKTFQLSMRVESGSVTIPQHQLIAVFTGKACVITPV